MTNSAFKKIAALLTAFALVGGIAYAGCMTCEGEEFVRTVATADCCSHSGEMSGHFQPKGVDGCCEGDSCGDVDIEDNALARRGAEVEGPAPVAVVCAPLYTAPKAIFQGTIEIARGPPGPPERTYLQHCSFLC